jgi:hypothetical protein
MSQMGEIVPVCCFPLEFRKIFKMAIDSCTKGRHLNHFGSTKVRVRGCALGKTTKVLYTRKYLCNTCFLDKLDYCRLDKKWNSEIFDVLMCGVQMCSGELQHLRGVPGNYKYICLPCFISAIDRKTEVFEDHSKWRTIYPPNGSNWDIQRSQKQGSVFELPQPKPPHKEMTSWKIIKSKHEEVATEVK